MKELRLAAISTIAAANAWLPGFMATHNDRFGRAPASAKDLHRKLTPADDLDEILTWREERTVTRNLTLHYDRMMLMLDPTPLTRGLPGKKIEVVNYPDGRFAIRFDGTTLPFRVFDKIRTVRPGAIVENKRRDAGVGEGATGRVRAAQASTRSSAATAAEQSGGTRPANEGSAPETWCRRSTRLNRKTASIVFRYVTENDHAERPQIQRRDIPEQRRAASSLSGAPPQGRTVSRDPHAPASRPPPAATALARCRH